MPMNEAQYIEELEKVNVKVNEQEARGLALIAERDAANAAKDVAIAERDAAIVEKDAANEELTRINTGLIAHVAELDALVESLRGTVPDSVVTKLEEVSANVSDNFITPEA